MTSDSSSTEDERIKEAIDSCLFNTNLYKKGKARKKSSENEITACQSPNKNKILDDHPLTIKVSSEFQIYVSKHLKNMLDNSLKDTEIRSKQIQRKKRKIGIKLLSCSKNYLLSDTKKCNIRKIKLSKNLYTSDFKKKAQEVAVSGEWVLSQKETEHWSFNSKGKIEFLKIM